MFGAALPVGLDKAAVDEQGAFFGEAGPVVVVGSADEAGDIGAGFAWQFFVGVFELRAVVK